MLKIVPLTVSLLIDFCLNAREEDLDEVKRAGLTFIDTPINELTDAKACALVDNNNVLFGIGSVYYKKPVGNVVWLLCTKKVEKQSIKFLRSMKHILKAHLDKHCYLTNTAYTGNNLHVKWLNYMGAVWSDKIDQQGFCQFWLHKEGENNV